jgi:hypothetical protein
VHLRAALTAVHEPHLLGTRLQFQLYAFAPEQVMQDRGIPGRSALLPQKIYFTLTFPPFGGNG